MNATVGSLWLVLASDLILHVSALSKIKAVSLYIFVIIFIKFYALRTACVHNPEKR